MEYFRSFRRRSRALIISAALLAAAVSGCSGSAALDYNDFFELQKSYLISQISSQAGAWFKAFESDTIARTISLSADVSGTSLDKYQLFFDNSALTYSVSLSEDEAIASGELIINGQHILGASGAMDEKQIRFYLPDANDGYYCMDTNAFFSKYGKDKVTLNDFLKQQPTEKELREALEAVLDTIGTAVTKETIQIETNQAVTLLYGDQKEHKCTVLTYTPEKESLTAMFNKLADLIESDETIRQLMNIVSLEDEHWKITNAAEAAAKLRENAETYADKIVSSGFVWKLAVEGNEIRKSTFITNNEEVFAAELTGNPDSGGETALYTTKNDNFLLRDTFAVKGSERSGTVILDTKDSSNEMAYNINRESYSVLGLPEGTYHFTLNNSKLPAEADLEVSRGDDGTHLHKITVKSSAASFTIYLNAAAMANVRMPEGEPTDITNLSETELNQFFETVGLALMQNVYPILMSLGLAGY